MRDFVRPQRFTNKVVLVTGSTRGIGHAIALAFAQEGAVVAINSEVPDDVNRTVVEMTELGLKVVSAPADVGFSDQVDAMVKGIISSQGRIDILVNNAGINTMGTILSITEEDWDTVLRVNLKSVFLCCKAVFPYMMEHRYGRIINMSSVVAKRGALFGDVHYATTKAGIIGFTKTLARTGAPYGITVNCVAPGLIATPLVERNIQGDQRITALRAIPVGRLGMPEEVASAVLYLASDEASYVTGATLDINGGSYMS